MRGELRDSSCVKQELVGKRLSVESGQQNVDLGVPGERELEASETQERGER